MSRYQVDKVLREIVLHDEARTAFKDDPRAYLAGRELTALERDALIALDYTTLYTAGAHPFLLNLFAMRQWPRAEMLERQAAYTKALAKLGYPNFST